MYYYPPPPLPGPYPDPRVGDRPPDRQTGASSTTAVRATQGRPATPTRPPPTS